MERILLLDAPCSTENIECKNNELVTCAALSKYRNRNSLNDLVYASTPQLQNFPVFPWTGGLWTKKIWKLIILNKRSNNLISLLNNVLEEMTGQTGRVQTPSIKNKVPEKRKIIFTCKLNCMIANMEWI